MTDDISKVVAEMRALAKTWESFGTYRGSPISDLRDLADRLESATPTAEVGEVERVAAILSNVGGAKWTPEEVARQLAERPNQPHYIAALVRKAVAHETATLARQLAEAKAEIESWRDDYEALRAAANTKNDALKSRAVKAESALAAAARRLGEVEGLVNDALALQQKHYGDGMDTHMALADWARNAKAAIDARLASDSATGEGEGHD